MAHIHELIDFVVSAFIVHDRKVLLVDHKKLGGWFPPGGHIELHETPDEALFREVEEETGLTPADLDVVRTGSLCSSRFVNVLNREKNHNVRALLDPWAVDVHDFPPVPGHRHVVLAYLLRSKTAAVRLEAEAHRAIRWFSAEEVASSRADMIDSIRIYVMLAILDATLGRRGSS